jgi:hypothetical protein
MFVIVVTFSVLIYNISMDLPYAIYVESCLINEKDPQPVTRFNLLAFRTGVIFNLCSVVVDVLMVKFIKQSILPTTTIHIQVPDLSGEQTTRNLTTDQVETKGNNMKHPRALVFNL